MSDSLKTVEDVSVIDPLYRKQREDVARMRASLLSFSEDSNTSRQAIQNITTLRVCHQLTRIVKYTEMCDKIEERLYECIDEELASGDTDPVTMMHLLSVSERLQKLMIDSHKLLEPYLDLSEFNVVELSNTSSEDNVISQVLDAHEREKLRNSAQAVLAELNSGDTNGS